MTTINLQPTTRPPFGVLRFWVTLAHDLADGCAAPVDAAEFWPGVVASELSQWQADPAVYEATWIN